VDRRRSGNVGWVLAAVFGSSLMAGCLAVPPATADPGVSMQHEAPSESGMATKPRSEERAVAEVATVEAPAAPQAAPVPYTLAQEATPPPDAACPLVSQRHRACVRQLVCSTDADGCERCECSENLDPLDPAAGQSVGLNVQHEL
jgi:hypothetical protein